MKNCRFDHSIASLLLMGLLIGLCLSACASNQPYDASLPKISIKRADIEEIKKFGTTYNSNPYMEPQSLLGGKRYEFYIVKIELNLDRAMNVKVDAFALAPSGAVAPNVHTKYSLIEFWDFVEGEGIRQSDYEKRRTTAEITALPSLTFSESPGRKRYYLVFSGKFPVKKPVTYHVSVFLSSGESESFQETVAQ